MRGAGLAVILMLAIGSGVSAQTAPAKKAASASTVRPTSAALAEVDGSGATALDRAVLANDEAAVVRLIRDGAAVNAANQYGVTPLALAAESGKRAIVEALLKAGANANTATGEGETVLMTAARAGNAAAVEALLEFGADPNARERWLGQTALMWAAAENHGDVVSLLLKHGAEVNASSSVIDYWALAPLEATVKIDQPKGGMAALHFAARTGSLDAIKALVEAPGVDLNQLDPDGVNALLYATLNGQYDVAAYLLKAGADPNLADRYGRTVVYAAVDMHRLEWQVRPAPKVETQATPIDLVKLAIEKGARVSAPVTRTPPNRCAQGCLPAGIEGATSLWRAARVADVESTRLLLAAGADPAAPARDGTNAVLMAAGYGVPEFPDFSVASESERIETLKLLLDAGGDVNATSTSGETALHVAAARGAGAMVQFLVDRGARLDAKDRANRTPLDAALGIQSSRGPGRRSGNASTSTAQLLRTLMEAKGLPIFPYKKPEGAGRDQAD